MQGGEGDHGVRVPKMVRGECALHEKRVRVQFFSLPEWAYGPSQYAAAVVGGPASIERSTTLRTEFKQAASSRTRKTFFCEKSCWADAPIPYFKEG